MECVEEILMPDTCTITGEFQFIRIKQIKSTGRQVIIGNVYRSPSTRNTDAFISTLDSHLKRLERFSSKQIHIGGDFNIDHIKHEYDEHGQNLLNTTGNHGFLQLISRPTRVTDFTSTLIDHIYSNSIDSVKCTSVITLDLSDHLGTFAKISIDENFETRRINARIDAEIKREGRKFGEESDAKFKVLIDSET